MSYIPNLDEKVSDSRPRASFDTSLPPNAAHNPWCVGYAYQDTAKDLGIAPWLRAGCSARRSEELISSQMWILFLPFRGLKRMAFWVCSVGDSGLPISIPVIWRDGDSKCLALHAHPGLLELRPPRLMPGVVC